jgi:hypothetical protein
VVRFVGLDSIRKRNRDRVLASLARVPYTQSAELDDGPVQSASNSKLRVTRPPPSTSAQLACVL